MWTIKFVFLSPPKINCISKMVVDVWEFSLHVVFHGLGCKRPTLHGPTNQVGKAALPLRPRGSPSPPPPPPPLLCPSIPPSLLLRRLTNGILVRHAKVGFHFSTSQIWAKEGMRPRRAGLPGWGRTIGAGRRWLQEGVGMAPKSSSVASYLK